MFSKISFTSFLVLVSSYTFGVQASGPVVFIEVQGSFQAGTPTILMPEATSRFQAVCVDCQLTIRKDVAEYLVVVAKSSDSSGEQWLWTVYENAEGMLLEQGLTGLLDDSFGDAAKSIMENWRERDIPDRATTEREEADGGKPAYVYVFRPGNDGNKSEEPPVLMKRGDSSDMTLLAEMDNGRWIKIRLEAGEYTFLSNDETKPAVTLNLRAGEEYFLEMDSRNWSGKGNLLRASRAIALSEIENLKPLDSKFVRSDKVM